MTAEDTLVDEGDRRTGLRGVDATDNAHHSVNAHNVNGGGPPRGLVTSAVQFSSRVINVCFMKAAFSSWPITSDAVLLQIHWIRHMFSRICRCVTLLESSPSSK